MVGRATEATTEQIRQASDIVDVVSAYVSLKRAGKDLKALCPFHKEKTPSFHVVPSKQIFKCFGCGVGGDVFKFVQLRENVDFMEARRILAERAGISLDENPRSDQPQSGPGKIDLERVNRWAVRWFQSQLTSEVGRKAADYAADRGINQDSIKRFAIGYAPGSWDALLMAGQRAGIPLEWLLATGLVKEREGGAPYDAFRDRLMFPIQDAMNRTLGLGGRTLGDDPAKYLNSPQSVLFDKSRCLYGLATAKDGFAEHGTALVVEGYTDCVLAHQFGFTNTVATLGTALTIDHVRILRRYVDAVYLIFDSDAAGQRAADQCLHHFLTEQLDVRLVQIPEGKDPADLLLARGADALSEALTSASGALEFKWQQVARRYRASSTSAGQRRAVDEFLELLASTSALSACDPIQRGMVLNRVAKLLGLSSEEVNRQLRIVARRTASQPDAAGPQRARPVSLRSSGAGGAAMLQLLCVLLNEPDYYDSVAQDYAPEYLPDARLRAVAEAVAEWAPRATAADLPALISRFESPETAALITRLQGDGEAKGNYAVTVDGAIARLRDVQVHRELAEREARVRLASEGETKQDTNPMDDAHVQPEGAVKDAAEETRRFYTSIRQAGNVNRFAARRHLGGPATVDSEPSDTRFAE